MEKLDDFSFTVTEDLLPPGGEDERVDKVVSSFADALSRSYIQKLLAQGSITVNGKRVKSSFRVGAEDQISIRLPQAVTPDIEPEDIPLCVLYEDQDVIVVDKPKNMVVHPAPGHYSGTLVNALLYHCQGNLQKAEGRSLILQILERENAVDQGNGRLVLQSFHGHILGELVEQHQRRCH